MKLQLLRPGRIRGALCLILATLMATAPSASAVAQGLGASQSVRGRALEVAPSPEPAPAETPPPTPPATPETSPSTPPTYSPSADAGKLDTTFVSPNASVLM